MHTDVIIVGKGIAALVLAFLLRQKGISPVILDRKAKVKSLDLAETLPPSALPLLHQLGLYSLFEKHSFRKTYGYHSLWGNDRITDHNFYFQHPFKHGLKINKHSLLTELEKSFKGSILYYDKQLEVQEKATGFKLTDHKSVDRKTKVLIDATGRNRAILKKLQIPILETDSQLAFTCHLPRKKHPKLKHAVFVEAFEHGWGLVSGLGTEHNVVSVFSHQQSPIFRQASDYNNWKTILQSTTYLQYFLEDIPGIKVKGMQANSSRPERMAGTNWLAVGDAALAFDPLCSHGISNAIYTAMQAATAIEQRLNNSPAFQTYHTTLTQIFDAYLASRTGLYRQEKRWSDTPYWKCNHQSDFTQIT